MLDLGVGVLIGLIHASIMIFLYEATKGKWYMPHIIFLGLVVPFSIAYKMGLI